MISSTYVRLPEADAERVAAELARAWHDPRIPPQQWELVRSELAELEAGRPPVPFAAFLDLMRSIPADERRSLVEVGCGCCHYEDVMCIGGLACEYTGVDSSPAFAAWILRHRPSTQFVLSDARWLPDGPFDVAMDGCAILHNWNWRAALVELVRASRRWVLLHRVPLAQGNRTEHWTKDAYGVPCFEQHFARAELLGFCEGLGCELVREAECGVLRSFLMVTT